MAAETPNVSKRPRKWLDDIWNWTPGSATNPRGGGKRGLARRKQKIAKASRRANR